MSQISEIVDSLENKIGVLLNEYKDLQQRHRKLEEDLASLKNQHQNELEEIERWKEKFETLKVTNSMLGSDQYKRDTKLKINALIRDLDLCIAQLSE